MELDVLAGAAKTVGDNHPIMLIEALKTDTTALRAWLENAGYRVFPIGMNVIAIYETDKCLQDIKITAPATP